jgi:hypothetical protein
MNCLPKVSIVIVNFNGERFIEKCLNSLNNLDYPPNRIETIIVDNGSNDNSLKIIKNKFSKIKVFINDSNNYCKANNIGLKNSKGEFIAFLNNDTEVEKNWLTELVKVIQQDKKIGIVGSKIIFTNGLLNSAGQREHPSFYFKDEGFKEEDKGQYDEIREVESLCGCSVLYRKECIEDIGLFDEDFIMYCEDVDMAIRCKNKGWKLYYNPQSVVKHEYNGSGNLGLQERYVERNRLLLLAKHHPDRLPYMMFSNAYFQRNDEIFQVIPEIVKKVITTHGIEKFDEISKDLFKCMKDYFYLKKDYLIKDFEIERGMFKESKDRLRCTNKKLEQEFKKTSDINKNLFESKEKLKIQLEKEIIKNKTLSQKYNTTKKELARIHSDLEKLKTDLNSVYNSKGYKLILSKVWAVSNKFKKEKKCL